MFSFLLPLALAEVPVEPYVGCSEDDKDACPSDLGDEWPLIHYVTDANKSSVREAELELGSGIAVDLAWQKTVGSWDVTVAILDSGIEWDEYNLANKVRLNTGELPLPQDELGVEADTHDFDGNGLVNVLDYAQDPRIDIQAGRADAGWLLDPSDLIAVFSDGTDDDGNGYADDIAGWDFFEDDNDAWPTWDSDLGTHGTGVMEGAVAEAENGGDVGVCPNCSLLPLRVADSIISDGNRLAEAMAYAVDNDARVIGMALGGLSHSAQTKAAIRYAQDSGVVVVAAAGDENTYHRNFPAAEQGVLYVHSVRGNNANEDSGVYSFMSFWNCNNYGPRTDLVAPANACATGAVSHISGLAGLLWSWSDELGLDLTTNELRQVLFTTVDDVHLSADEVEEASAYPSQEGWDGYFGYGRVDAQRAVDVMEAGDIPPAPWIEGLGWYDYLIPGSIELTVHPGLERSGGGSWALYAGQGFEPSDWELVASGEGTASSTVNVDSSGWGGDVVPEPEEEEGVLERVERVHAPDVTFELVSTGADGLEASERITVLVHDDPDLLDGFPVYLGTSGESSPVLADFDGDGAYEIAVATAEGEVHVVKGDGSSLEGWPVLSDPDEDVAEHADAPAFATGALDPELHDGFLAGASAGDLDGDGSPELVAAGLDGAVYAWHADGTRVDGFPVQTWDRLPEELSPDHLYDKGVIGAPTLYDLDGDGTLEVVVAAMDSRIYAWDDGGELVDGYPFEACHPENCGLEGARIITSVTIGDVDGDGDPDLGFGTNETLYDGRYSITHLYDAGTQTSLPGWPRTGAGLVSEAALLPVIAWGHPASLAFADLEGDGDLEILDAVMLGQPGVLDHEGNEVLDMAYTADSYGEDSHTSEPSFASMSNNPSFGDLDNDGVPDPFMGGSGTYGLVALAATTHIDFQQVLGGWSGATGQFFQGWPRQVEDLQFFLAPAVADISGDGLAEVIYGSGGGVVHAWNALGAIPEGWPKFTGQWILGSAAIGDLDGDGYLDVVTVTRDGYLFAWRTEGHADTPLEWNGMHHDAQNTGNYETPLPVQAGPEAAAVASKGCCNKDSDAAWLLLPLVLLAARRREL